MKKRVAVFGAGKIGMLVTHLLAHANGDYEVLLVDSSLEKIESARRYTVPGKEQTFLPHTSGRVLSFTNVDEIEKILSQQDYVVSCAPFYCNLVIAEAAQKAKVHYLDLTEDVQITKKIKQLAQGAPCVFIPQCGLAPGFITIITNHLVKTFDKVHDIKMRVGALPMYPHNRLKYNLTWSTDGLINEYCNPCEMIENGKKIWVRPLEGAERLTIDGEEYEAFNTSGGLGTLAESLEGQVTRMDYKSIRYPGHRDIICTLLEDLRFQEDRETLKGVFERSLPHTSQDVVIVFVTVTGMRKGSLEQESYVKKIYHSDRIHGEHWGAIQITTAAGICAVLDMHATGNLPQAGFVRQEDVSYTQFVNNRFGKYYAV
jgi:saccharopine dehydrogenase-like NADP-dependent oxidoreductase